jgi:hypothetical protein
MWQISRRLNVKGTEYPTLKNLRARFGRHVAIFGSQFFIFNDDRSNAIRLPSKGVLGSCNKSLI